MLPRGTLRGFPLSRQSIKLAGWLPMLFSVCWPEHRHQGAVVWGGSADFVEWELAELVDHRSPLDPSTMMPVPLLTPALYHPAVRSNSMSLPQMERVPQPRCLSMHQEERSSLTSVPSITMWGLVEYEGMEAIPAYCGEMNSLCPFIMPKCGSSSSVVLTPPSLPLPPHLESSLWNALFFCFLHFP